MKGLSVSLNLSAPARLSACLLAAALALLLPGCSPSSTKGLKLPPTPSILDEPGWVLVTEAYATLRDEPGIGAKDRGHLRDGTILAIEGRAYAPGREGAMNVLWFLVSSEGAKSWLSSTDCQVYTTYEQATRALSLKAGK